ncbi:hypothetical protein LCGC14_2780680, partial [marine sediment metagenome]
PVQVISVAEHEQIVKDLKDREAGVSLEWLEKWCKEYSIMNPIRKEKKIYLPDVIEVNHLLKAARRQVKKEARA